MSRNRFLGIGVLVVVLAAAAGWFAGTQVQSPADAAANAREPTPSAITARVEQKQLSTAIVTRGTARFNEPLELSLAGSSAGGANPVVTKIPEAGADLKEGSVALEVAGRPVFTLIGAQPMYRDLGPGSTGQDVQQLEEALVRLGFDPGPVDGTYDTATANAVSRWFLAAGYEAQGPSEARERDLRTARDSVTAATNRLRDAEKALADRQKPPTTVDLLSTQNEIQAAKDAVAAAKTAAVRDNDAAAAAVVDKTTALALVRQAATRDLERARIDADTKAALLETTRATAARDVANAQTAVSMANSRRDAAATALQRAQARYWTGQSGLDPDSLKPITAPALEALQQALEQATTALTAAANEVESAGRALPIVQQQSTLAVQKAQQELDAARQALADQPAKNDRAIKAAEAELAAARTAVSTAKEKGESAIRSAENQGVLAEARFQRLQEPPDAATLEAAVRDATTQLAQARADFTQLDHEFGILVPASSVIFVPSLPARIDSTRLVRGDAATGKVMTVTGSALAVDSSVTTADAKLLKLGDKATIEATDAGITVQGTITKIGEKPGTNGLDGQHVYVQITPDSAPAGLKDAAARVTIPVQSTDGAVLAVPIAAVSTRADGSSFVQTIGGDGAPQSITVRVGLTASGLVEVTPLEGSLKAGDRVVVGRESAGARQ